MKEEKAIGKPLIVGENRAESESNHFKKKRRRIINFIGTIVLVLIGSIFFGLGALITQGFMYSVLFSIILLFTGIVELFAMLIYSIESED